MSPLKKKKLNLIRKKLDKIDNDLIKIIKKRTFLVKKVLKLKEYRNEIIDKKNGKGKAVKLERVIMERGTYPREWKSK